MSDTPRAVPKPGPAPRRPDSITIYRTTPDDADTPDGPRFRWMRRTAAGALVTRSKGNYPSKAQAWRNVRRTQTDWDHCRIVDETGTWNQPQGGTNLNRDPAPLPPPPRRELSIREARGRL